MQDESIQLMVVNNAMNDMLFYLCELHKIDCAVKKIAFFDLKSKFQFQSLRFGLAPTF